MAPNERDTSGKSVEQTPPQSPSYVLFITLSTVLSAVHYGAIFTVSDMFVFSISISVALNDRDMNKGGPALTWSNLQKHNNQQCVLSIYFQYDPPSIDTASNSKLSLFTYRLYILQIE